jgi:hypothetical protein
MAFPFTARYERDVEERMQGFYQTLSEKDRRRYAAIEARKLGRGGVSYVAEVLGCSTRTIARAASELDQLPNDPAAGRVRRPGGGLKKSSKPSHDSNKI